MSVKVSSISLFLFTFLILRQPVLAAIPEACTPQSYPLDLGKIDLKMNSAQLCESGGYGVCSNKCVNSGLEFSLHGSKPGSGNWSKLCPGFSMADFAPTALEVCCVSVAASCSVGTPTPTLTPTPCSLPDVPQGLKVDCAQGGNSVSLSWVRGASSNSSQLRVDDMNGVIDSANIFPTGLPIVSTPAVGSINQCTYLDTQRHDICLDNLPNTVQNIKISPGKEYKWWVHSVNSCGASALTLGTSFKCPAITGDRVGVAKLVQAETIEEAGADVVVDVVVDTSTEVANVFDFNINYKPADLSFVRLEDLRQPASFTTSSAYPATGKITSNTYSITSNPFSAETMKKLVNEKIIRLFFKKIAGKTGFTQMSFNCTDGSYNDTNILKVINNNKDSIDVIDCSKLTALSIDLNKISIPVPSITTNPVLKKCTPCSERVVNYSGTGLDKGDIDCSGKVQPADFNEWEKEYYNLPSYALGVAASVAKDTYKADVNCDSKVNKLDYSLWLNNVSL